MQSLFPMPNAGGRGNAASAPLFQVKAGKCTLQLQPDGKYMVTPDTRKGKISLVRENDQLLHFKWENRVNNQVEDDRIIFPGDATFKKVKTGREHDRVYLLTFHDQKFMYWIQDVDASKDADNMKKINDTMTNPPAATTSTGGPNDFARMMGLPTTGGTSTGGPTAASTAALGGLDLSSLLGSLNPRATAASSSSSGAINTTSAGSNNNGRLTAAQLQQALAGTGGPTSSTQPAPRLEDILTSDAIMNSGVLTDPVLRQELISQLPEGQQSEEHLEENLRSAQFQQSLGALSDALQTDGGSGVTASFGIDPAPGTGDLLRGDAVGAFLSSVQAANPSSASSTANAGAADEVSAPPPDASNDDSKMEE